MIKPVLLLGNPELYEISRDVSREELPGLDSVITDLHDTLMEFRRIHQAGRAVAAPQIGVKKRILYMYINHPVVFLNPCLTFPDDEMMEVLDDCMSFPGLYVRVQRHRRCTITYRDMEWNLCTMELEGDLSELLQHEYDHLDGILATMKAMDSRSFYMKDPAGVTAPSS